MKNNAIVTRITQTAHTVGFALKKHSPEILVIGGLIGGVGAAVMACRATTKIGTITEKTKEDIDLVHESVDAGMIVTADGEEEYTPEDAKKDLAIIYFQTAVKFAKLYGPSVALGLLSITSILASYNIMRKRNVALAAAFATVDKGFREYRNRVVERFGEAVDRELKYNIKAQKIEETVVDEETGKEKKVKKTVEVANPGAASPYARFFDVGNPNWKKNADYNFMFLRAEQNYFNDLLRAKKHVFLNEVLGRLGFDLVPEGQIVGWIYDPNGDNGDNYIDFGIYDMYKEATRDFIEGHERTILLDFNVDGNIWELMRTREHADKFQAF